MFCLAVGARHCNRIDTWNLSLLKLYYGAIISIRVVISTSGLQEQVGEDKSILYLLSAATRVKLYYARVSVQEDK